MEVVKKILMVCIGNRWGFIDPEGRFAIPSIYERARSFSGGLAYVTLDSQAGYIDKTFVWKQGE